MAFINYYLPQKEVRKDKLNFMGHDIKVCGLYYTIYKSGEKKAIWETSTMGEAIQWIKENS